jgi:hypothetical protein
MAKDVIAAPATVPMMIPTNSPTENSTEDLCKFLGEILI